MSTRKRTPKGKEGSKRKKSKYKSNSGGKQKQHEEFSKEDNDEPMIEIDENDIQKKIVADKYRETVPEETNCFEKKENKKIHSIDDNPRKILIMKKLHSQCKMSFAKNTDLVDLFEKITPDVEFSNFSGSITDLSQYAPGKSFTRQQQHDEKKNSTQQDSGVSMENGTNTRLSVPDIGKDIICVGMHNFMKTLDDSIFKHLSLQIVNGYIPLQRHVVVYGPEGSGKSHCTRAFCQAHMIDFIQINPYQAKPGLIQNVVRFACMTKTPTVVFFNESHTWLTQAGSTDNRIGSVARTGNLHQTKIQTAPFLGDFLHCVHNNNFLTESDMVWFVYGTTIDPKYFYSDFLSLPGIVFSAYNGILTKDEILLLTKFTFKQALRSGFDIDGDHLSDTVLLKWANSVMMEKQGERAKTPCHLVRSCQEIIMRKKKHISVEKIFYITSLQDSISEMESVIDKLSDTDKKDHEDKKEKWKEMCENYIREMNTSLIINEEDLNVVYKNNNARVRNVYGNMENTHARNNQFRNREPLHTIVDTNRLKHNSVLRNGSGYSKGNRNVTNGALMNPDMENFIDDGYEYEVNEDQETCFDNDGF